MKKIFTILSLIMVIAQVSIYAQLSGKKVLFATKAADDQPFRDKFTSWGATVTVVDAATFNGTTAAQFATYDLVFLSETLGSSDLTILKTLDAPILTTKAYFGKSGAGAWFSGSAGNISTSGAVEIVDNTNHQLAAGFSSGSKVTLASGTSGVYLNYLPLDAKVNYIPIAKVDGDLTGNQLVVTGLEKGAKVYSTSTVTGTPDRTLKARIAVVGIHTNADAFVTADAWTILQAAAKWVIAGGVTNVEEKNELPSTYSLSQNYPNPFNPATIINYTLSKNGFVRIAVYDLLGNEIKTLVNEERSAGSYSVSFDAAKLSSGIYFYKIQTGGFVQTKKMVLMK